MQCFAPVFDLHNPPARETMKQQPFDVSSTMNYPLFSPENREFKPSPTDIFENMLDPIWHGKQNHRSKTEEIQAHQSLYQKVI